ncbi:hypothetical protein D3C72_2398360 [compost metagenome]
MVRLDYAHAIDLQTCIFKRRANIAKQVHKVALAVFWCVGFIVPFVVKLHLRAVLADGARWVIFGWGGNGDKHPLIAPRSGGLLNTGDHRH